MKTPPGYKELALKRLPLLLQIKAIQEDLDRLDAPFIDQMAASSTYTNHAHPRQAAEYNLKRLHKAYKI